MKELETVEMESEELEVLRRELDSLIYAISHDLRAPIRSILGFSEALEEDHAGSLNAEALDHLKRLRSAAIALDESLEGVVELSRISRREMRRETVSISAMAASLAETLEKRHPGREIEVVVQPDLTAVGDPYLLEICLRHLLDNAFKFTRPRPRGRVEVGREERQERPILYIRDNGVGFDPRFAGRMFGAFQRLHPTSEFKGAGMGLAIVQRIAHRHGATVWAVGQVDEGTTVYLTL